VHENVDSLDVYNALDDSQLSRLEELAT